MPTSTVFRGGSSSSVPAADAIGAGTYAHRVSYTKDPRVDAYVDGLPRWQQTICQGVRDLVHAADAQVQETIKRRVQPYFVLEGNICVGRATRAAPPVIEKEVRPCWKACWTQPHTCGTEGLFGSQ